MVPSWFSPFPQSESLQEALASIGSKCHEGALEELPQGSLLLYHPPHWLLDQQISSGNLGIDVSELIGGYRSLGERSGSGQLVASWRILQLDRANLAAWLKADSQCQHVTVSTPNVDPLLALLTLRLLDRSPGLLEAYLDLELEAQLMGTEPDSAYRMRLDEASQPELLLDAFARRATLLKEYQNDKDQCKSELAEAKEESELMLLQLHQVQEELEHYFLLSQNLETQLQKAVKLQQRSLAMLDMLNPGSRA